MTGPATLLLEDGRVFGATGTALMASRWRGRFQYFNDGLSGDPDGPSYAGPIVTMTYPLIGNTGINPEDVESRKPFLKPLS